MTRDNSSAFLFDDVRVEPAMFRAFKADNAIPLEPKAFRLLLFLIENRGRLIEKEEILRAVWNGAYVTENALASEIAKLRKALADDSKTPKYIQTVRTLGYRFIAPVQEQEVQEQNGSKQTKLRTSLSADSNEFDLASPWSGSNEVVTRRPAEAKWWGKRLAVIGMIVALAVAALIGLKIYQASSSRATVPVTIRQITTWSGMDCNPSFSPDGESIAYSSDHSGDFEIYVKSLAPGARNVQLTTDGQQNFDPAWSPDGKRIAYYSMKRHGIFAMPAFGGVATQLTDFGSHPVWSPDGQWLAFQSISSPDLGAVPVGGSTIWIVSSQGGASRQVTQPGYPAGSHFGPSWSPDGKRIAFINFDTASPQVWSIAASGDRLQSITKHGTGDKSWPLYAADGKSIYYNRGEALWKTPISSDSGAPAGEPVKVADLGSVVIRNATLSASGRWIAYSAWTTANNLVSVPMSQTTSEPGGAPSFLTNETATRHVAPAFSPDGSKIAFTVQVRGTPPNIWTIDATGGNSSQVTIKGGRFPSWYPDGKQLAFLSDRDGKRKFWSTAAVGGNEKTLFQLDGVESPRMSPDGNQFAFNLTKDGIINVVTVPVLGGEPRQVTDDKELAGWPCWSPDGEFLAVEIKRGDDTHIAIVPSKGGPLTQLTFEHGQSWPYSWSPDGDKILFAGARDGVWNLWWVSRSDKTVKQLTHNTKLNAFFRYPAWSPHADLIVSEYSESRGNIYLMEIR
jgi:Tol biopolymer transport system component/DNA-binding winged helix-turn-helix (wHTH) protein